MWLIFDYGFASLVEYQPVESDRHVQPWGDPYEWLMARAYDPAVLRRAFQPPQGWAEYASAVWETPEYDYPARRLVHRELAAWSMANHLRREVGYGNTKEAVRVGEHYGLTQEGLHGSMQGFHAEMKWAAVWLRRRNANHD
mgnify:CR=1 FL=1